MRIAAWALAALLLIGGIAAAALWERPWAAALRCDLRGDVPIGTHCHEARRDVIGLRAGDGIAPGELSRLADLPRMRSLAVEAELIETGFEAFPALPDLQHLYVELHGRETPIAVSLEGIDRFAPAEGFRFEDVVIADAGPLAGLDVGTLTFENTPVADLPADLPKTRGIAFRGHPPAALDVIGGAPVLDWLSVSGPDLPPLGPLAQARALRDLTVSTPDEDGLGDLAPLAALTGLRTLFLSGGGLGDLTPLAGLKALDRLSLGRGTPDLAPLADLPALRSLSLYAAEDISLAPLADAAVTRLVLERSGGIAGLSSPVLEWLELSHAPRLILSRAGDLPALTGLVVEDVALVRLGGMPDMPRLASLRIERAESVDLTDLASAAPALERLDLRFVPDVDLSALNGHGALRVLVSSWEPAALPDLRTLPALRELQLGGGIDPAILSGLPLVRLDIDLPSGAPLAPALPLPQIVELRVGQGVVTPADLAAMPRLETVQATGPDGRTVRLSGRAEIDAWIEANR